MSHRRSAKESDGNPVHIAEVKAMVGKMQERFLAKIGHDVRVAAHLAQDALAKALAAALVKNGEVWGKWRGKLREPLDLSGADLSGFHFAGLDFDDARMVGVNLQNSVFLLTSFRNANLEGADFSQATVAYPFLEGARLAEANFSGATLEAPSVDQKTDFAGATFTGCAVKRCGDGSGGELVDAFRLRLSAEQQKQLKADACFIATAACGDVDAWEVVALREFRDRVLAPTAIGRFLVETYYRLSPPLAAFISRRPPLRAAARTALIRPLARSAQRLMRRERPSGRD
jgi:hypothetical protein